MKVKSLFFLLICFALSGCVVQKPLLQFNTPYNESDFAPFAKEGKASIVGQAFLKTQGGEVRFGAGSVVTLIPSTPYTEEFFSRLYERLSPDTRWKTTFRSTVADGSGHFEFQNLPSGSYWLEVPIYWQYAGQYGLLTTGSTIQKRVTLGEDQKLKLVLTQ